jgi:hypothetical protein
MVDRCIELKTQLFTPLNTTSLTVFALVRCSISIIRNDTFVPVNNLRSLSISKGKIDSVERGAFNELNKLETMYLHRSLGQTLNSIVLFAASSRIETAVLRLRNQIRNPSSN